MHQKAAIHSILGIADWIKLFYHLHLSLKIQNYILKCIPPTTKSTRPNYILYISFLAFISSQEKLYSSCKSRIGFEYKWNKIKYQSD